MKTLLVLLAVCAFSAAMVPRYRRAVNSEEEKAVLTATTVKPKLCAPQTPCAWFVYHPITKVVHTQIENKYCKCAPELECQSTEDDVATGAFVHRCRVPSSEDDAASS